MTHRVIIVGGGFAGLNAAQGLRGSPTRVTLFDRENFHLFQPLLYQVATGGLSPGDITAPIRSVLRRVPNANVLLCEVLALDLTAQTITTDRGPFGYETLIVATGVRHHYFGHPEWERFAPGLKSIADATEMRRRVLTAFEAAEHAGNARHERQAFLTFVIVGAGPTGVELAGAMAELSRDTLRGDFRQIDPSSATIVLVEGSDRVLPGYPPSLSARAKLSLERLGVTVRLNSMVSEIDGGGVKLVRDGRSEFVASRCVLWGAGIKASPLGPLLAAQIGRATDPIGRVRVEPDLTVPGHPEVFVLGDLAYVESDDGNPLPGVAPVAMQQGRYAARTIVRRLTGLSTPAFHYVDKGNLATIGRKAAVADFGRLRFSGMPAWLLWLGVHLFFLVGFENRVMVFIKWGLNYFSRNRGARLIVGADPKLPEPTDHQ